MADNAALAVEEIKTPPPTTSASAAPEPQILSRSTSMGIGPLEEPLADDQTVAEQGTSESPAAAAPAAAAPAAAAPAAAAPAAAAPAPMPPIPPELIQAQQVIRQQQAALQQAVAREIAQQRAQEDAQTRAVLEGQGYTPEQVQQTLTQIQGVRQQQANIAQERTAMHEYIAMQRADDRSKITVAQLLSKQYGMPFNDLMTLNSPHLMEANAKTFAAEQRAAKAEQAKVQPQKFASTAPGAAGPMSYERLRERKINGETLTDAENKVLYPDRY